MISALRRTRLTAEALMKRAAPHANPPKESALPSHCSPDLALPAPDPLKKQLVSLGVNESSAAQISSAFVQSATRLKEICASDYHRRRQSPHILTHFNHDTKSSALIPSAYLAIYTRTLDNWASYLIHNITPRVLEAQSKREAEGGSTSRKKVFNQSAVPFLEQFFEGNAFPSRLEKFELASKCNMEYRQIHVWFQNRRSRHRKEGKRPRRPSGDSSLLRELEETVVDALLPPGPEDELEIFSGACNRHTLDGRYSTRDHHITPTPRLIRLYARMSLFQWMQQLGVSNYRGSALHVPSRHV
ncbi:hypothetical protein C2E23DRAFT_159657 [Lenzites betulinus]|nr:hypothetical protein C2E23DRAFT_159657 [Lenzites betulinus]